VGKRFLFLAGILVWPALLMAQASANYRLEQGVINAGGNPMPVLASTNFKMTLDAIGDAVAGTGLSSASYNSECGFTPDYAPPREVLNQRFPSKTIMTWNPEPSVGAYNVYRGNTAYLGTGSYGSCLQAGLPTASYTESSDPSSGQCWFYLVTAENRLNEEGTSGYASSGAQRPITGACP
jgi:hypothetical protein